MGMGERCSSFLPLIWGDPWHARTGLNWGDMRSARHGLGSAVLEPERGIHGEGPGLGSGERERGIRGEREPPCAGEGELGGESERERERGSIHGEPPAPGEPGGDCGERDGASRNKDPRDKGQPRDLGGDKVRGGLCCRRRGGDENRGEPGGELLGELARELTGELDGDRVERGDRGGESPRKSFIFPTSPADASESQPERQPPTLIQRFSSISCTH